MEFELSFLLLGLPLAFAMGWLASRWDMRQWRLENQQAPKAYFKGLNFLLNEQQDQAIDAFIEAVQNDPDTSELHFALGNLFRRRGEYERAVRVHQHLLARADLSEADRHRAQHALALDFLKAGLLDRAEDALLKLEGTRFEEQARMALLANYERSRDWAQAAAVAQRLHASGQGDFSARLAHYLCEQAAQERSQGRSDTAQTLYERAIDTAPEAARPPLELAQLLHLQGHAAQAISLLLRTLHSAPHAAPLVAQRLGQYAQGQAQKEQVLQALQQAYEGPCPSLDVLDAIVALQDDDADHSARDWYVRHLSKEPSLVAAAKWIEGEKLEHDQFHPQVQRALNHAVKPLTRYRCAACGFEAKQHFWHCPGCQSWDSYPARRVEEL